MAGDQLLDLAQPPGDERGGPGNRERVRRRRDASQFRSRRGSGLPDERAALEVLVEPLGLAQLALGVGRGLVLAEDALALAPVH